MLGRENGLSKDAEAGMNPCLMVRKGHVEWGFSEPRLAPFPAVITAAQ